MGLSIKTSSVMGGRDCPVRIFCGQGGGVFQMRAYAILGGRSSWISADILRTREEESIFRDFMQTSFMNGP